MVNLVGVRPDHGQCIAASGALMAMPRSRANGRIEWAVSESAGMR